MTTTPASRPAWKGRPPRPTDLRAQLLQQLPDEIVFGIRQLCRASATSTSPRKPSRPSG